MPLIDKSIFNELKQISGEDFINELNDAFLEDAPNMLNNMKTALETKDRQHHLGGLECLDGGRT